MEYKILINSKGVPVLVGVPHLRDFAFSIGGDPEYHYDKYEQAISTALADESKHIVFKDELSVREFILTQGALGNLTLGNLYDIGDPLPIGQSFDLPENIGVSFWCNADCDVNHGECCHPSSCQELKRAILTPKPESVPSCGSPDGRWISVRERLPEDYSLVLINLTSGAITVGRRLRTNNWGVFTSTGMDCESMTNHVEFWMPLPKAPTKP